jgi:hypothetical protein
LHARAATHAAGCTCARLYPIYPKTLTLSRTDPQTHDLNAIHTRTQRAAHTRGGGAVGGRGGRVHPAPADAPPEAPWSPGGRITSGGGGSSSGSSGSSSSPGAGGGSPPEHVRGGAHARGITGEDEGGGLRRRPPPSPSPALPRTLATAHSPSAWGAAEAEDGARGDWTGGGRGGAGSPLQPTRVKRFRLPHSDESLYIGGSTL